MPTERQEQIAVVQYVKRTYPNSLMWATPNGGSRHPLEAANMRKEGVLAGVPDLFIAEAKQGYHGLFIEMKRKGGQVTANQGEVIFKLRQRGYKAEVCYGADEAIKEIDDYLRGKNE